MKKTNGLKLLDSRDAKIFYISVIGLPVLQFLIFYIGVNFNSILLAFKNYDSLTGTFSFAGITHFKTFIAGLFKTSTLIFAVRNSLIAYVVGLIVGLPLTLLFSWYIYRKCFMYKTMRFFLFLPSILPIIVLIVIFNNFSGVVFPALGMFDILSNPETQFATILFFNTWIGFGSGVLFYAGSMSQIDPSLIEAASIDGAGSFRQFFSIILPGIYGTMSTFLVTGVSSIFLNQANLFGFFAESARTESYTLGYYLFTLVLGSASYSQYPYASAAGITLTLVAAPLTFFVKWALEKFGPKEN